MSHQAGFTASRNSRPRGYIDNYQPQAKTLVLLNDVKSVLAEYRKYWPLTVRQVFYRLVGAHDYEKSENFYGKLCHHMANARRGRVIPFEAIRDDGVTTVDLDHFDDEEHFRRHIRRLGEKYTRNKLADQDIHIEVWCEAAGMIFQLAEVAKDYSIPVYSSSGFDSLTAKKDRADRIVDVDKPTVILHLGDLDPSGESIFESAAADVTAFVRRDRTLATTDVDFRRVALTRGQVEQYRLPTAPPKATDSRSRSWSGETCQLEALPPNVIADLLQTEIERLIDPDQYEHDLLQEQVDRGKILALSAPEAR